MNSLNPLFVDLDGTLIQEDLSHEAFFYFFILRAALFKRADI